MPSDLDDLRNLNTSEKAQWIGRIFGSEWANRQVMAVPFDPTGTVVVVSPPPVPHEALNNTSIPDHLTSLEDPGSIVGRSHFASSPRVHHPPQDVNKSDSRTETEDSSSSSSSSSSASVTKQNKEKRRRNAPKKKPQGKRQQQQQHASRQATRPRNPAKILQQRQVLRDQSKQLLRQITVDIPKSFVGFPHAKKTTTTTYSDDDNDNDEEDEGQVALRSFTRQADAIVRQHGVVLLKKQVVDKNIQPTPVVGSIYPRKLLTVLRQAATIIQNAVIARLDRVGKVWNSSKLSQDDSSEDYSFSFQEVASGCLGRLDIRYGMNQAPYTLPEVLHNAWLWPTITSLLGDSAQLVYCGLILSFPGSYDQPWHQDGQALFPELLNAGNVSSYDSDEDEPENAAMGSLPPYALNVFVPLTPIESALGPTEFWVGSHKESHWKRVQQVLTDRLAKQQQENDDELGNQGFPLLETLAEDDSDDSSSKEDDDDEDVGAKAGTNKPKSSGIVGPTLTKGDVLIYDYRICHRGTANVSTTAVRPMLYLMYARPWFAEHVDFGKERLFANQPPLEFPTIVGASTSSPASNKASGQGGNKRKPTLPTNMPKKRKDSRG